MRHSRRRVVVLVVLVVTGVLAETSAPSLLAAAPLSGTIDGRVLTRRGAAVAGVAVTLSGVGHPREAVTSASGGFSLSGVAPGGYLIKLDRQGYLTDFHKNIAIEAGRTTHVELTITPFRPPIVVTSGGRGRDTQMSATGTTLSERELERLPTSRNIYDLVRLTPLVTVDRIDGGGSTTGQSVTMARNGSTRQDNAFRLNGVDIRDYAAPDSTPFFFVDPDVVQDVRVSTGGEGPHYLSPGATVDFTTKSGASNRAINLYGAFAGGPLTGDYKFPLVTLPGNTALDSRFDVGGNVAGPLPGIGAWYRASYNWMSDDRLNVGAGQLANGSFSSKSGFFYLDKPINLHNRLSVMTSISPSTLHGVGADPQRDPDSLWTKTGTPYVLSLEDRYSFKKSLMFSARYSRVNLGSDLTPVGSPDAVSVRDTQGVFHDNYFLADSSRHSNQFDFSGSYSTKLLGVRQDLKFGYQYEERFSSDTSSHWPGNQLISSDSFGPEVFLTPSLTSGSTTDRKRFYAQDQFACNHFSANLGIEGLSQSGRNSASFSIANPLDPSAVPGVTFPGGGPYFDWSTITPHLGFTYAPKKDFKIGVSYAGFAENLTNPVIELANPLAGMPVTGSALAHFDDANHNGRFDIGEAHDPFTFIGKSWSSPTALNTGTQFVQDLKPSVTHELNVALDYKLKFGDFRLNFDKRHTNDLVNYSDLSSSGNLISINDYLKTGSLTGTVEGQTINQDIFASRRLFNGVFVNNTVNLRERDGWDVTAGFHHRSKDCGFFDTWYGYGRSRLILPVTTLRDPNVLVGPDEDGAPFADQSVSSNRQGVWLSTGSQFGFDFLTPKLKVVDVSGRVLGRSGFYAPRFVSVLGQDNRLRDVEIDDWGSRRYSTLVTGDLQFSRSFHFCGHSRLRASATIYNVLNSQFVVQKQFDAGKPGFGQPIELTPPRTILLGARLAF